jgi:hypothetical protein
VRGNALLYWRNAEDAVEGKPPKGTIDLGTSFCPLDSFRSPSVPRAYESSENFTQRRNGDSQSRGEGFESVRSIDTG